MVLDLVLACAIFPEIREIAEPLRSIPPLHEVLTHEACEKVAFSFERESSKTRSNTEVGRCYLLIDQEPSLGEPCYSVKEWEVFRDCFCIRESNGLYECRYFSPGLPLLRTDVKVSPLGYRRQSFRGCPRKVAAGGEDVF
jgi:hypothetical protein